VLLPTSQIAWGRFHASPGPGPCCCNMPGGLAASVSVVSPLLVQHVNDAHEHASAGERSVATRAHLDVLVRSADEDRDQDVQSNPTDNTAL
jgi:hypothetical protein